MRMKETINTNSFVNSINNITLFAWITWHQKQHLCCVVYSHCPTNDSYNKDTHGCCLPCSYATKSFGILQKVIKSQRVLISPYVWTQQKSLFFLSQKFVAKFADITLNFPVLWKGYPKKIQTTYQCAVFKKMTFLLFSIWKNVTTLQTAHGNLLTLCKMGLLSNINFLSCKHNSKPKTNLKIWSSRLECLLCIWNTSLYLKKG